MSGEIKCPACGGSSRVINEEGSIRLLKCFSCGNEFSVRIHFVEPPITLTTKVFRASVKLDDPSSTRKTHMKIKMVFSGCSNFYSEDLERQIAKGLSSWDLGLYSEQEVETLKSKAAEIDLSVDFLPE